MHEITTLAVADMGPPLPMGLLLPLTSLKSLNLSGNHMDNVSLFILTPISTLQVSVMQLSGHEGPLHPFVMGKVTETTLGFRIWGFVFISCSITV